MMRAINPLMALLVWLCASMAYADGFGQALQQLAAKPVVRAQFQQSKQIANTNKPLVSKGDLLFVRGQGVLWQLKQPVQADLVVSPRKMVQKTARTQSVVNLKQTPYGPAANVLLLVMSGNESALRQHFQVTQFKQTGGNWQASLLPTSGNMKALFSLIDISGGGFVNKLTLLDTQQRPTVIVFSNQATSPSQLNSSENALFKLAQ